MGVIIPIVEPQIKSDKRGIAIIFVGVPAGSDPAGQIGWQLSVKRTR